VTEKPFLPEVGRRLMEVAADQGLAVRLLGGVAIWLRASEPARALLGRDYPDLDLVAHEHQSRALRAFLEEQGYAGDKRFNAVHGAQRLLFFDEEAGYQIDVFLDRFNMSHVLDLGTRLEIEPITLTAADLLLTKLQIAEVNRKDVGDIVMLLWSHGLGDKDGPTQLNVAYLARLCAGDWGLYTTVTDNLATATRLLPDVVGDAREGTGVDEKIAAITARLDSQRKTITWKARARVGRRVRWYELPDEVQR
jgi:hypothetical protein